MNWLYSIIILLVLIALIISAILILLASKKLVNLRGYDNSSNLQTATSWYNWTSIVVWFGAILTTILLIIYAYQSSYSDIHRHNFGTHLSTKLMLWILLIVIAVAAIFLFIGYEYMKKATAFTQGVDVDPSINTYIITSLIILGACFLTILIISILLMLSKPKLHCDEISTITDREIELNKLTREQMINEIEPEYRSGMNFY